MADSNAYESGMSKPKTRVYIPKQGVMFGIIFIACLAVAGWTGYLLYSPSIGFAVGVPLLAFDILVLAWAMSLFQQPHASPWRLGILSALVLALLLTLTAFAGIEPLSGLKDWIIARVGL